MNVDLVLRTRSGGSLDFGFSGERSKWLMPVLRMMRCGEFGDEFSGNG